MSIRRILIVGSLVGASLLGANEAFAAPAGVPRLAPATGSPSKPSKPKPTVTTERQRENLRLKGTQRSQESRTEDLPPPKSELKKPRTPTDSTPTREERAKTSEARQDLRLHDAGCKPTEMQGKVEGPNVCTPDKPDEPKPTERAIARRVVRPQPEDVTWEQIRSETKGVTFPGLSVKVQPHGRTLVNLETIVYTDDNKISTTTVTLLGFPVVVQATPMSYTWNFGDGSPALTTSSPGKPYPSKDITHKYLKRGDVGLTLTTSYAARFNVAGTGWQYVAGTIPVTGPTTALQVREAVPVLVDPER
jgi:hypothetical protein